MNEERTGKCLLLYWVDTSAGRLLALGALFVQCCFVTGMVYKICVFFCF